MRVGTTTDGMNLQNFAKPNLCFSSIETNTEKNTTSTIRSSFQTSGAKLFSPDNNCSRRVETEDARRDISLDTPAYTLSTVSAPMLKD